MRSKTQKLSRFWEPRHRVQILNEEQNPEAFQVLGTAASGAAQSIKVAGNGDFAGVLYAPNADLEIKGNENG